MAGGVARCKWMSGVTIGGYARLEAVQVAMAKVVGCLLISRQALWRRLVHSTASHAGELNVPSKHSPSEAAKPSQRHLDTSEPHEGCLHVLTERAGSGVDV